MDASMLDVEGLDENFVITGFFLWWLCFRGGFSIRWLCLKCLFSSSSSVVPAPLPLLYHHNDRTSLPVRACEKYPVRELDRST